MEFRTSKNEVGTKRREPINQYAVSRPIRTEYPHPSFHTMGELHEKLRNSSLQNKDSPQWGWSFV